MNYLNLYADFLKRFLKPKRELKVVFDCSDGVTGIILKELFRKSNVKSQTLKVTPFFINDKVDGNFPAHGPNPLANGATKQLEKEVKKQKADLGVIFDGDGDRVFFLDNKGRWIDPNESAYILMQIFKPPYVVGIVSSWRLKESNVKGPAEGEARQGRQMSKVFVSRVGHYFFKNLMRKKKASLGLEHSGHYYFKDFFYCDSGIFAAIQVINFISGLKTDLASWLDKLPKYYRSGEINFRIENKELVLREVEKFYKKSAKKISKIDGITMEFSSPSAGSGQNSSEFWFNLRPSNTENLIRLNIETTSKLLLDKKLKEIKKVISFES
ncbi:MAG: hypothetical protein Q7S73_02895 [bacterium]|nr:hypothetical protein [bacterium]